jgi:hypothetical protein
LRLRKLGAGKTLMIAGVKINSDAQTRRRHGIGFSTTTRLSGR